MSVKAKWYAGFLVLLISGCISVKPSHLTRNRVDLTRQTSNVTKYRPTASGQLFKASLALKKHILKGYLAIRKTDPPLPADPGTGTWDSSFVYRFVFANEIGMTYFDLELNSTGLKVISCLKSLNKTALLKILETDFRMMTRNDPLRNEQIYQQSETNHFVVSGVAGKRYKIWQTYSPFGDTLYATSAKSTISDPVIITYKEYLNGFPVKITIENPFIGLKMSLRKLTN